MKKSEFKERSAKLFKTYQHWFDPNRNQWGGYEITYMPGWITILEDLFSGIESVFTLEQNQRFQVNQIKEKFGTLRFYYSGQGLRMDLQTKEGVASFEQENPANEYQAIDDIIRKAAEASAITCMFCGDHGNLRTDGWSTVLCDHHYELDRQGKRLDMDFELMTTPVRRH